MVNIDATTQIEAFFIQPDGRIFVLANASINQEPFLLDASQIDNLNDNGDKEKTLNEVGDLFKARVDGP